MRKQNLIVLLLSLCLILTGCLKKKPQLHEKPAITLELIFTEDVEKDILNMYLSLEFGGRMVKLPYKRVEDKATITLLDISPGVYELKLIARFNGGEYSQKWPFTVAENEKSRVIKFNVYAFKSDSFSFMQPSLASVGETITIEAVTNKTVTGYTWVLEKKPDNSNVTVTTEGTNCIFTPDLPGEYSVRIKKENSIKSFFPITINVYEKVKTLRAGVILVQGIEGTSKFVYATYDGRLYIQEDVNHLAEAACEGYPLSVSTNNDSVFLATSSKIYQFTLPDLVEKRSWDIVANDILALSDRLLIIKDDKTVLVIGETNEENLPMEGIWECWLKSPDNNQVIITTSASSYYLATDNFIPKPVNHTISNQSIWFDNNLLYQNGWHYEIIVESDKVTAKSLYPNYIGFSPARHFASGNIIGYTFDKQLKCVSMPIDGQVNVLAEMTIPDYHKIGIASIWYAKSTQKLYSIIWDHIVSGKAYLVWNQIN